MLQIKDRPGVRSREEMRALFETCIKNTPAFSGNTPLAPMEINDKFAYYMAPDTDTMWLGFALGVRKADQIAKANATDADSVLRMLGTGEWELMRHMPSSYLTDEANNGRAWSVKRQQAPFCDLDGNRVWAGATAIEAMTKAGAAIDAAIAAMGGEKS